MSEAKDPAIKLFGKTIPLPEVTVCSGDSQGAPPSSAHVLDDNKDQEFASSSNSSPEANTHRDAEEQKLDKV